jgi:hypothetical protein
MMWMSGTPRMEAMTGIESPSLVLSLGLRISLWSHLVNQVVIRNIRL